MGPPFDFFGREAGLAFWAVSFFAFHGDGFALSATRANQVVLLSANLESSDEVVGVFLLEAPHQFEAQFMGPFVSIGHGVFVAILADGIDRNTFDQLLRATAV